MKKFLILFLALWSMNAWAEKVKFTLTGTARSNATQVEIFNMNTQKSLGKVKVKEGKFSYSATLPDDTYLRIVDAQNRVQNFVITDGPEVELDMTKDMAKGSPMTEKLFAVSDQLGKVQDELFRLKQRAVKELADTGVVTRKEQIEAKAQEYKKLFQDIVEENKENCLPVYLLFSSQYSLDYTDMVRYAGSEYPYSNHPMMAIVRSFIEKDKEYQDQVGKKFLDVSVNSAGRVQKLSDFVGKGNYVLVDFWASWCVPCMREMPTLKKAYARYHQKGLEIVGISLDNDRNKWIGAISKHGLSWPQLCDLSGFQGKAPQKYNVHAIPWSFICDGEGNIVAVGLRGYDLIEFLDNALK